MKKWRNKNFIEALKHSFDGIKYTLKTENNLKVQLIFAFIAVILAIITKLNVVEWVVLVITIGIVLFAEMVNTAIENVLDVYSEKYSDKIKVAKDIASGAVLMVSGMSVIVGGLLFLPKLI